MNCKFPGCVRLAIKNTTLGYCTTHQSQFYRTGEVHEINRVRKIAAEKEKQKEEKRQYKKTDDYKKELKYKKMIRQTECNKNNKDILANSNLKRKYGITLDEKNRMAQSQNYSCMICGNKFKNTRDICVDHNHQSNKIRDLLCYKCNAGLGMLDENIERFEKCIAYIKKWQ